MRYFLIHSTKKENEKWDIVQLVDYPSSDATLIDLDGDGKKELVAFSPFHGHKLRIYKLVGDKYELAKEFEEDFNFLHAIWAGKLKGKNIVAIGHRRENMNTFILKYENSEYVYDIIDENVGAANINYFVKDDEEYLIAANRETDAISIYKVE